MHSLRLSDRTMSYDAGLNIYSGLHHQKPPKQDHDDEANEADDGTIIIDPHNGATIKGKSHRKISTGKRKNYIHTPHFLLFLEEERLNSYVIVKSYHILVSVRGFFLKKKYSRLMGQARASKKSRVKSGRIFSLQDKSGLRASLLFSDKTLVRLKPGEHETLYTVDSFGSHDPHVEVKFARIRVVQYIHAH